MAFWVDQLTPIPFPIAQALIEGLRSDSVVRDDSARRVFPSVDLIPYEQAVQSSLQQLHPDALEPVWINGTRAVNVIKHEGFFVDHRRTESKASCEAVYRTLIRMGGRDGWPHANGLWQLRLWLDRVIGGSARPGRTDPLRPGEALDGYQVDQLEVDRRLRLHSRLRTPGEGWMEWCIAPDAAPDRTVLTQTAFFAPRGLPGFAYWYLLYPLHAFVFRGLIRAVARKSEQQ